MSSEQVMSLVAGAVALLALLVAVRAHHRATQADARAAALVERIAGLEAPVADISPTHPPSPSEGDTFAGGEESAYVITHVDDTPHALARPAAAAPIEPRLFADIVARETVVKAGSWAYGLRRALAPATRNRIRFEVRRETKRAGRERRAEMKQALREFRARERSQATPMDEDVA